MKIEKPHIQPYFKGEWKDWNGLDWILTQDWKAHITTDTFDVFMRVKKGFITDFGSIPKFYRSRVNRMGKEMVAWLPHDVGYATEMPLSERDIRKDWDWLMLEMLQWVGIGWSKRNACYTAVRWGGGSVWAEHTMESIDHNLQYLTQWRNLSEDIN